MKLLKFLLSFTLTCLIGGAIYIGYKNNFWNVFNRLKEDSPEGIIATTFNKLENAQSAQITGTLNCTFPLKSKDNRIKKDADLQITAKIEGKLVFPNQADITASFDLTSFQKILSTFIEGEAVKKVSQEDLNSITLSLRAFDDAIYFFIPSLWQKGWIKKEILQNNSQILVSPQALLKKNKIALAMEEAISETPTPSSTESINAETSDEQAVLTNTPNPNADTNEITILSSLMLNQIAELAEIEPAQDAPANDLREYSAVLKPNTVLHSLLTSVLNLKNAQNLIIKLTVDKKNKILKGISLKYSLPNKLAFEVIIAEYEKNNAQRLGDLRNIQLALEDYYEKNNVYPKETRYIDLKNSLVPDFISVLPRNPQGENYRYATNEEANTYELFVQMDPNTSNSLPSNLHIASQRKKTNFPALIQIPTISNQSPLTVETFSEAEITFDLTFENFDQNFILDMPVSTISIANYPTTNIPKTSSFSEVFDEIVSYNQANFRDAKRINDLLVIEKALNYYFADNGSYFVSAELSRSTDEKNPLKEKLVPKYLSNLPLDPLQNRWYGYKSANGKNYLLTTAIENPNNPYAEEKTNHYLLRLTNLVPLPEPTVSIQKDIYYLEEIIQKIPVFNHLLSFLYSNSSFIESTPKAEAVSNTPIPTNTFTTSTNISLETAQISIQKFENNNIKNVFFKEEQILPFGIMAYFFTAELKEPKIKSSYLVNSNSGEILRRELLNQNVKKNLISPEQAQKTALDFVQKRFQDFEKQNFEMIFKNPDYTSNFYRYFWIKKDTNSQAILPTKIEVKINPESGNPDYYNATRVKVALDNLNPLITQAQAEKIALAEADSKNIDKNITFKVVESVLMIVENPQKPPEQVLVWQIFTWQDNNSEVGNKTKGKGYVFFITADTGNMLKFEDYPVS